MNFGANLVDLLIALFRLFAELWLSGAEPRFGHRGASDDDQKYSTIVRYIDQK